MSRLISDEYHQLRNGQIISYSLKAADRRARKDRRAVRAYHPSPLVTKGAPARREKRDGL